jgi:hypothetical protein
MQLGPDKQVTQVSVIPALSVAFHEHPIDPGARQMSFGWPQGPMGPIGPVVESQVAYSDPLCVMWQIALPAHFVSRKLRQVVPSQVGVLVTDQAPPWHSASVRPAPAQS